MTKPKKLTSAALNKLNKEQNTQSKISVLNGEYEVVVDDIFSEAKIDKIIHDYLNMFAIAIEKEGEDNLDEDFIVGTIPLLHTLIFREFTDLKRAIPKGNNIVEIMEVAQTLYSLGKVDDETDGLMVQIIKNMNPTQLNRVYSKIDKSSDKLIEFSNEKIAQTIQRMEIQNG